jgi:hypothetical protein
MAVKHELDQAGRQLAPERIAAARLRSRKHYSPVGRGRRREKCTMEVVHLGMTANSFIAIVVIAGAPDNSTVCQRQLIVNSHLVGSVVAGSDNGHSGTYSDARRSPEPAAVGCGHRGQTSGSAAVRPALNDVASAASTLTTTTTTAVDTARPQPQSCLWPTVIIVTTPSTASSRRHLPQ